MNIGLAHYRIGDGPLAQLLGGGAAQFEVDLDGEDTDRRDLIADAQAHGLAPIADLRTSLKTLCALIYTEGRPIGDRFTAMGWYAARVCRFLDRHPLVQNVEVWGDNDCPCLNLGVVRSLDYGGLLEVVAERVRREHPEVRLWTGGFGPNCLPDTIHKGLARYAPAAFDVCNYRPLLATTGDPAVDCQVLGMRLDIGRAALDQRCKGQPFAASCFGVPTTAAGRPPRPIGLFYLLPHTFIRAVPEGEALEWYTAYLRLFAAYGFETVCFLAQDGGPGLYGYSGLRDSSGGEKCFVRPLADWLHTKLPTGA